ncbi:hypothetical protein OROGR_016489 [Orobanche gracilis]
MMASKATNLFFFIFVITSLLMLAKSNPSPERINFRRLLHNSNSVKPMDHDHPSLSHPPPPPQQEFQQAEYSPKNVVNYPCPPPKYFGC